jgi:predicted GNAT superfamily acetyltransferase
MAVILRDLHALDEFRQVNELEAEIWGTRDDTVATAVYAAGVPRGAVLVGAFEDADLVGFCYSFPALAHGRLIHWSHITGVSSSHRCRGIGFALKQAQRVHVQALGIGRIDWTFDPLQAGNAHFNVRRLGALVEHYEVNVYGQLVNPLHGGLPTDRFVAQWRLDSPGVRSRMEEEWAGEGRAAADAPVVNPVHEEGGWPVCDWSVGPPQVDGRIRVAIPGRFVEMMASAPDVAMRWRLTTRRLFQTLFARRYRVSDFVRAADGGGAYVLEQDVE